MELNHLGAVTALGLFDDSIAAGCWGVFCWVASAHVPDSILRPKA